MRPSDLLPLQTWDERKPELADRILYLPVFYELHDEWHLPPLNQIFENDNPIHLEYCSGNGEWITRLAVENPNLNWIAVERQFKRVRQIWSKMKNHELSNLLIVCGNAEDFSKYYLPQNAISQIYINFPDPWPKNRHAKNRLIKSPFVEEMARICKEDATAYVVTDDVDYSIQVLDEMESGWKSLFQSPYYVTEYENYGSSFFNRLWIEKGKKIRYMKFRKK